MPFNKSKWISCFVALVNTLDTEIARRKWGRGVDGTHRVLTALRENAFNNVLLKLLCDYTFMTVGCKVSLHPSFYN